MEKQKRIFWLCNHTSLRMAQVPMLIDMGYEVYCPKIYSWEYGDFSGSVTYEYDASLSIPKDIIDYLNTIDFYTKINRQDIALLNQYFGIAICMALPSLLDQFVTAFSGVFAFQGFGLSHPYSYTEVLASNGFGLNLGKFVRIRDKGNQFFMIIAFQNLVEAESDLLKTKSLYLPIPMKNATPQHKWIGGDKRILFISPKIKTNSYYYNVYKEFCENFGDLPHVIGGAQLQEVPEDKTVKGFLPDEEYSYNMKHLAAMFYHSREPRHLHYHPLEAVKWGMPLVFMAGGMLDYIGGKDLPGRATSIKEARKKLQRLLNGDKAFIQIVTKSQEKLLRPYTEEYCRPFWEAGMQKLEAAVHVRHKKRKKRIAVILPAPYLGGVYDYAIRFCLILQKQIMDHKAKAEMIFAYPANKNFESRNWFGILRDSNINVREFMVEEKDNEWAHRALRIAGWEPSFRKMPISNRFLVLRDGGADFQDCDYSFFVSDYIGNDGTYPLLFFRPYTMVVHDYIQRYVPAAVSPAVNAAKIINQRNAQSIFVTSEPSRQDAIVHAGLSPEKVILSPPLMDFPQIGYIAEHKENVFVWSTNATPHKNHLLALQALESYYRRGGRLDCVITGANTEYLNPILKDDIYSSYAIEVKKQIRKSKILRKHLLFRGNMEKEEYYQTLKRACFVFHPGYGDNGNFTVTDAAAFGVPSLVSDYPAMRWLADYAELYVRYMNPHSPENMSEQLWDMEQHYMEYAAKLPSCEQLAEKSYWNQGEALYELVKDQVPFDEDDTP